MNGDIGPAITFASYYAQQGLVYVDGLGVYLTGAAPADAGSSVSLSFVPESALEPLFDLRGSNVSVIPTVSKAVANDVSTAIDSVTGRSVVVDHCGSPAFDAEHGNIMVPWMKISNITNIVISEHHPITLDVIGVYDIRERILTQSTIQPSASQLNTLAGAHSLTWDHVRGFWLLACGTGIHMLSSDFTEWLGMVWTIEGVHGGRWGASASLEVLDSGYWVIGIGDGQTHPPPYNFNQYMIWDRDGIGTYEDRIVEQLLYEDSGHHTRGASKSGPGLLVAEGDQLRYYRWGSV